MARAALLDGVDVSQDTEGPEWRRRVRAAITEADANFTELYAAPGAVAIQNKYTAVATGTPATLTGTQMVGAQDSTVNMTAALGGAGTLNCATAVDIYAAAANAAVGRTYKMRIINSSASAFSWTLTTAAGVTLTGTMTIAQNTWRDFLVTLTSATAVAIQSIGTGTFS